MPHANLKERATYFKRYKKQWYEEHRDLATKRSAQYYQIHREQIAIRDKQYRQEHRAQLNKRRRENYRRDNSPQKEMVRNITDEYLKQLSMKELKSLSISSREEIPQSYLHLKRLQITLKRERRAIYGKEGMQQSGNKY